MVLPCCVARCQAHARSGAPLAVCAMATGHQLWTWPPLGTGAALSCPVVSAAWVVWGSWWHEKRRIGASPARVTLIRERAAQSADHLAEKRQKWAVLGEVVCDLSKSGKASPLQPPPSPPGLPPVALRSPLHVKTHNAARVAHLPGDHSQVGWLPPSCVTCHYFEKDSSLLKRGSDYSQADWTPPRVGRSCCPTRSV